MIYEQTTLDNGLRIVTHRLNGRDSIGLAIWVRVGGRHERKRLGGISHFVEHMLFKGTKQRSSKQIREEVEGVGGVLNAFTGEESTCYFVKIQKAHFRQAFDVLQDMVHHASLGVDEFKKEQAVILEEIKMYLDLPSQYVHEIMSELLWPMQPLGRPIAGTIETVSHLERKDLYRHVQSYYHPRNLLITVCGEVDHGDVEDFAAACFKDPSSRGTSEFEPARIRAESRDKRFRFIEKKTEQTHFVIGFHGLSRNHPDRYRLAILNVILGANMSSRLFEEVREKRGLAYEIRSGLNMFNDTGSLTISAGVEPKKGPLAVRVIMRELGRLKKNTISKSELRRAKDYFLGQLMLGLEDTLDHALWFGERLLYGGDVPDIEKIKCEVEKVNEEDIQHLSSRFFKSQRIHLSLIGPLDSKMQAQTMAECLCP